MKNENVYEEIFSDQWCPLFGELPNLIESPHSQLSRCIEIIRDARRIWEIEEDLLGSGFISNLSNWPKPEEVDCPEWVLNSARGIWRLCYHIQYNVFFEVNPIIPYIEKADGTIIENRIPLPDILIKAVEYARGYSGDTRYAFDDHVPDVGIIAILVIYTAWHVLEDVLYHGESQENVEIIREVQIAGDLLRELDKVHIEKLEPDAERGVKNRDSLKSGREIKDLNAKAKTEELQNLLQEKADQKWKEHPDWSIINVARALSKELWSVGYQDPRKYKVNHIRKFIKKP